MRALLIVLLLAGASPVWAKPSVAVHVEGPGSDDVRARLVSALSDEADVRDADVSGGMDAAALRESGAAAGVDAVVAAQVTRSKPKKKKQKPKTTVRVLVVDVASGEVLLDEADPPDVDIASSMSRVTVKPSVVATPEPEERETPRDEEPAPRDVVPVTLQTGRIAPMFAATVAMEVGGRRFAYNDALTSNLRGYQVAGVPLASVAVQLFPFGGKKGALRDVGFDVSYQRALYLSSATPEGMNVDSTWSRLEAVALWRLRARKTTGPLVTLGGGFGLHDFTFDEGTGIDDELPNVSYSYLRVGAGLIFPSGRWSFGVDAAWMPVLGGGDLMERFPQATAQGVDVRAIAVIKLARQWDLRIGLDYMRYFYDMKPEPGDQYVAGGALDEFFVLQAGVTYAR